MAERLADMQHKSAVRSPITHTVITREAIESFKKSKNYHPQKN
jgi:hypothetical protein